MFLSIAVSGRNNYIVVYSDKFYLKLFDANGKLLKCYPVGLGLNGMGKTREGDKKTPVGEYEIIWKASRFAKKMEVTLFRMVKLFAGLIIYLQQILIKVILMSHSGQMVMAERGLLLCV
jgi:hypothetical protein